MILIAIGSNLAGRHPSPLAACGAAVAAVAALPGLRLVAASDFYRSAPIPAADQPDFINAVVRLEGSARPAPLLAALHAIEAGFGRVRGAVNSARELDLDLIDLDGQIRPGPDPVLPHPRAHLRAFVLYPLRDVAPDWHHPTLGQPIDRLLAELADQPITRLAPDPDPSILRPNR